eukprot:IDg16550t1
MSLRRQICVYFKDRRRRWFKYCSKLQQRVFRQLTALIRSICCKYYKFCRGGVNEIALDSQLHLPCLFLDINVKSTADTKTASVQQRGAACILRDMKAFVTAPALCLRAQKRRHLCRRRIVRACEHPNAVAMPEQPPAAAPAQSPIDPTQPERLVYSAALQGYAEQRAAGLISPFLSNEGEEWADAWTLSVLPRKAVELKNQYSRVGILIEHNFSDFEAAPGADDAFHRATLEDLSRAKARLVYNATGLPSLAETHDLAIDAPESGSKIHKTLQQGYYTRNVAAEGDIMIDRVRPISDENRATRFVSCVAYFDGEMEIVTHGTAVVSIAFSAARYATVATAAAFDDLYKMLTRRLGLQLFTPEQGRAQAAASDVGEAKKYVGAIMLRERLMREGKLLDDGIVKVSSFLNHMVDVDLMEEC